MNWFVFVEIRTTLAQRTYHFRLIRIDYTGFVCFFFVFALALLIFHTLEKAHGVIESHKTCYSIHCMFSSFSSIDVAIEVSCMLYVSFATRTGDGKCAFDNEISSPFHRSVCRVTVVAYALCVTVTISLSCMWFIKRKENLYMLPALSADLEKLFSVFMVLNICCLKACWSFSRLLRVFVSSGENVEYCVSVV